MLGWAKLRAASGRAGREKHGKTFFGQKPIGVPQRQQIEQVEKNIAENKETIGRHVIETHSTTEVVGRMASEARVKAVVLNHLVGGPGKEETLESFESRLADSVRTVFTGPVTVGRDQMRL